MTRLFGTDGVRDVANTVISADMALILGRAVARVLGSDGGAAIVGRDTRASGDLLAAAMSAGIASAGLDVLDVGAIPTPAVGQLTVAWEATFGVVISASHNPFEDNGIKFFNAEGFKLADSVEDQIEVEYAKALSASNHERSLSLPTGASIGRITNRHTDAVENYADYLVNILPEGPLSGLNVVLDLANGAAFEIGQQVFERLGAEVIVIGDQPNGVNINDRIGSTHPEALQAAVLKAGADLGLAFDGDADRCLAVDNLGRVINGDQILGILGAAKHREGRLANSEIVATQMTNIGLIQAMARLGIKVAQTAVGDRYVLEYMLANGSRFGGEQSGHFIDLDFSTTGDGQLAGVLLAQALKNAIDNEGKSAAELADEIPMFPQVLINVDGVDKSAVNSNVVLQAAVLAATEELGSNGRVLLRASGTQNLVRVMVEAATEEAARAIAERLAKTVEDTLTLSRHPAEPVLREVAVQDPSRQSETL